MKFASFFLALYATSSNGFNLHSGIPKRHSTTSLTMSVNGIESGMSRRAALSTVVGISALIGQNRVSFAAGAPPTKEELERIRTGYKQIQYLLENFEQETTVCRENGGECKRDAEPIRRALGLRSTTDPLFQIEKVFAKVKNMDIDPDKLEGKLSMYAHHMNINSLYQVLQSFSLYIAFFEASEDWNSAMTLSNSMAFISQFGEYNPGGGKDEVLKYLNESQKQVVIASNCLKTIMDCLGLEA